MQEHYNKLFALVQFHHWSLSDLEDLPLFELDMYIEMIAAVVKEQNGG